MEITNFFQRLTLQKPEFKDNDSRIAAIALAYYVINAGGTENKNELAALVEILKNVYHVNDTESKFLLEKAESDYKNTLDFSVFTDIIKDNFSKEDNLKLIRFLYDLAYCDGHVYELEDNVIWRIATMLDVSDNERIQLKKDAATVKNIPI